ncbi:PREDICTED: transmembrane protein 26-like [Nanorana parkeri]|uniref:transmembrane protein 26-like n=1 Tax=Nanorana parkeri TaxID=125878 RepID=UPI000854CD11|nr:PREDICTED: transmembrane protein 26-like [Nanorana parkeri]
MGGPPTQKIQRGRGPCTPCDLPEDNVEKKMAVSYCKILSAILSRVIFTVHGFLLVWQVVLVKHNPHYWMLVIGLLLLYVEMVLTITITRKGEWKWFSPMVFLYLASVIPSVFILELEYLQTRTLMSNSSTSIVYVPGVSNFKPSFQWLEALEQVMVLVLVITRWLMPKGEMSRDQLSQLLLIYIGLGADLLDILLLIKEPSVATNQFVTIVGLSLFSWAVLHFTLVLTAGPAATPEETENDCNPQSPNRSESCASSCCTSEVWSLLIAVLMQDGPFLIFRLYLTIKEGVLNEMMIFFICKNILTVFLEIYRIAVIQYADSKSRKGK